MNLNERIEQIVMEPMILHEDRISGEELFHGRVISLQVDQVRLLNGRDTVREVVRHPGGVAVVALTPQNELFMVRQFRYPFQRVLLELPAGKLEPGEEPLEAAKREQKEETGTQASHYISLGTYYATPAYCTEQIHLWACRITAAGEQQLDPGEFLELETVPLEEAFRMVLNNEIPDGKTQLGILKTYALVRNGTL